MDQYTTEQIKTWIEAGVNVSICPTGDGLMLKADGSVLNANGQLALGADSQRAYLYSKHVGRMAPAGRLFSLGAPIVADDDKIVTSANMKNGAYTIAAQPDVPRNVTVTATAGATADTMGIITVTGKRAGVVISEVITPEAGSTVAGALAFDEIDSVVGSGWAIDESEGTNDTIKVGIGNELGLPFAMDATSEIMLGILGTTITAHNPTVSTPASLAGSTIDMSAGTYNGTKVAMVFLKV